MHAGIVACLAGAAEVVSTDLPQNLPLLARNIQANGTPALRRGQIPPARHHGTSSSSPCTHRLRCLCSLRSRMCAFRSACQHDRHGMHMRLPRCHGRCHGMHTACTRHAHTRLPRCHGRCHGRAPLGLQALHSHWPQQVRCPPGLQERISSVPLEWGSDEDTRSLKLPFDLAIACGAAPAPNVKRRIMEVSRGVVMGVILSGHVRPVHVCVGTHLHVFAYSRWVGSLRPASRHGDL